MNHEIIDEQRRVLISLSGGIYLEDAVRFREMMRRYVEQGSRDFIIDLEGVDYIDSAGLGMLITMQKRILKNGGSFVIKGVAGLVRDLFLLTRLDKVFEMQ